MDRVYTPAKRRIFEREMTYLDFFKYRINNALIFHKKKVLLLNRSFK
jgi:hypothetical protein